CALCNEHITGDVLTALDKLWHVDHFRCAHCQTKIGTDIFYERDGLAYCEHDYIELFSPKCFACNDPILNECVSALERTWHPHHFSCHHCGVVLKVTGGVGGGGGRDEEGSVGFHEMEGQPYCSRDFFNLFALKCSGCRCTITSNYVTALNQKWHNNCFVCTDCKTPFTSGSFYDFNGFPYCERHFNATRGGLCFTCKQPITGASVMAMSRRYHPGHFVCTFCLQALNMGTFKEHNDRPYCNQCSKKLFR
ncbi:hypothetical protein HELRODRAFT_76926, partial [Helobdella robusta]|uniref:LIM zinc-binding domain-containing protein n=1 Tax=Helobdella robusta TaxID=6412 RepID=T1G2R5_HELRO